MANLISTNGRTERNWFSVLVSGAVMDSFYAADADEALDLFAATYSGYETFAEMRRSAVFSVKYPDVTVEYAMRPICRSM